jgi:hypothetical protein
MYPQIVSEDIFNIVQEKNKRNRYGSHSPLVNYLLHRKIVCGYCGRHINGITGTSRTGEVIRYYCCSGRYNNKDCEKKTVRKDALEEVILKAITKIFESVDMVKTFADKIIEKNIERLKNQSILNILQQEQANIMRAKRNLIRAIEDGVYTATTKTRLEELEIKESELAEKIIIEESKQKLTLSKEDIIEYITKALHNSAERVIDLLVKKIVLYDDKIIICCNYTNKKTKDNKELDMPIYEKMTTLPVSATSNSYEIKDVKLEVKF